MGNNSKSTLPPDDDWLSITVDINDGWADDVPLIYPEGSWRPDEHELTTIDIKNSNLAPLTTATSSPNSDSARTLEKIKQEKLEQLKHQDSTIKKERKLKGFWLFLVIWISLIAVTLIISLTSFYSYLVECQNAYDASRPSLNMDEIMKSFEEYDIDAIYSMITLKPEITDFESEEILKEYITNLLADKTFKYTQTPEYTEETPCYYIQTDDTIISKVCLTKKPDSEDKFHFSQWYTSNFEFYTNAQYNVKIEKPSNYKVYINDIEITDDYCLEDNIKINDAIVFKNYSSFPTLTKYQIEGLYNEPVIKAYDCFGNETAISWNEERAIYEVPFSNGPDFEKMVDYCVAVVEDYALYKSGDTDSDVLDKYFPENSELLQLIKADNTRQNISSHTATSFDNIYIDEFDLYSDKYLHCKISFVQHFILGTNDTPLEFTTDFYYVNNGNGWKVIYKSES